MSCYIQIRYILEKYLIDTLVHFIFWEKEKNSHPEMYNLMNLASFWTSGFLEIRLYKLNNSSSIIYVTEKKKKENLKSEQWIIYVNLQLTVKFDIQAVSK